MLQPACHEAICRTVGAFRALGARSAGANVRLATKATQGRVARRARSFRSAQYTEFRPHTSQRSQAPAFHSVESRRSRFDFPTLCGYRARQLAQATPKLDKANLAFHTAYHRARKATLHDAPLFVLLGDDLIVLSKGSRRGYRVGDPLFHVLKTIAHLAVATVAILRGRHSEKHAHDLRQRVKSARESVVRDLGSTRSPFLGHAIDVLDRTLALNAHCTPKGLRALGARLLVLTSDATAVQLAALHATVEEALTKLDATARKRLEVVVAGNHQARQRSVAMQYFKKRFAEPENVEDRVTYAEAVTIEHEALTLVATRRADRELALALFGDAKRLQRDVQGDAAALHLERLSLDTIR